MTANMDFEPFPQSIIIVGAGVFGLSTALEIARKYPTTRLLVIDRMTPPVVDGTSVDTSRIIRPDYIDSVYEILAERSRELLKADAEIAPYYFENGFTFATDGNSGEMDSLWNSMLRKLQSEHFRDRWDVYEGPTEVFQAVHGHNATMVSEQNLPTKRMWNKAFISKRCATVNAEAIVGVYYDRARSRSNIQFLLGTPVDRLLYGDNSDVLGVILEGGRTLKAEKTILATGAWSSRLVNLNGIMAANAVSIAYIKLTEDELVRYHTMGCFTHLGLGVNIFTPVNGLLKVLRRGNGVVNTTVLKDPENHNASYLASYPLTAVDQPKLGIPPAAEHDIREALREIFPAVADRPFHKTRICWLEQTTNGEFLICPHPKFANLHMATGGSLHGWKFLPLLGEFVVDSINSTLNPLLREKWSWESKKNSKLQRLGFMVDGETRELAEELKPRARL